MFFGSPFWPEYSDMSTRNCDELLIDADSSDLLKKIIEIEIEFNQLQDQDILLERILFEARRYAHADAGSIYICEGSALAIRFAQNDTKQKELPAGRKLIYNIFSLNTDDKTISGYCAVTGKSLNIPDVYNLDPAAPYRFDPEYDKKSGYRTVSALTVPLKTNRGGVIGVLQIINAKDSSGAIVPFDGKAELFVEHFAVDAASALHRAILTRTLLLRMMLMAQMRDPKETGPHVNRVAGYAVEIYDHWAARKNIPEAEREKNRDIFRMAAMLHDVGKVAISDLILKKPGSFTPEEYEIMRTHTYLGARIFLDKQSEFDEMAADVALMHHENWDGSGYPGYIDLLTGRPLSPDETGKPLGRKGEEISIYGRITALADVYDALRSVRVYKQAWTEDDVLKEIRRLSGVKFDPELVDIFLNIQPEIRQISEKYIDKT